MKSIKKFRSTRHALKQSESDLAIPAPPAGDDEFPLGPRLFRKSRPAPNQQDDDTVGTAPPDAKGESEADSPEPDGLKIIPSTEWEMVVRGKNAPEPGSESEAPADNPPEADEKDSRKSPKRVPRERTASISEQVHESEPQEPKPVVVRPLEEPAPVDERQTEQAAAVDQPAPDGPRKSGRPAKGRTTRTVAEKLKPYALSVGSHSYVLVDDEGRLVKPSSDAGRKQR